MTIDDGVPIPPIIPKGGGEGGGVGGGVAGLYINP